MISLRLFHNSDPSRQIEARNLEAGELVIGREPPSPGWRIDDPDRQLSRNHCTIAYQGGVLSVRDTSANGVQLSSLGGYAPKNTPVTIQPGETLKLGQFTVVIERAAPVAPVDPLSLSINRGGAIDRDSPFAPPPGIADNFGAPSSANPFGSEIKRDPLSFDAPAAPIGRDGDPLNASFGQDAWDRREARKAGDWDAPSANQPQGHEHLIGSDRHWSTPPPPPKSEVGLGFDTPFEMPILKSVEVSSSDLEIPQDWDLASIGGPRIARAPAAREPEAPRAPFIAPAPPVAPLPAPPLPADPIVSPGALDAILDPPAPIPAPPEPIPPAPEPVAETPILAPPPPAPPPPLVAPPPASAPVASAPTQAMSDRSLLEAFCAGAKLDPEVFAREDPQKVMEKLGAVYQQMVLGLADLISERSTVRNEYRMVRTTVRPAGNNPFKWAPPPRVAVDLLRSADEGFLTGAPAVKESFEDMKKHVICLLAGMRAAVGATLDGLAPEVVEGRTTRSILKNPGAAAWAEFRELYADFKQQADDNPDSQINREFRSAYERQLEKLDGLRPPG